jgi:hypothetical protein
LYIVPSGITNTTLFDGVPLIDAFNSLNSRPDAQFEPNIAFEVGRSER